ncbi:WD40 repeat domain-containing protein [Streptomyces sp. NPDC000594]|uniref:WD40 repeat domain-containing protein n=1 Tax=Streptomyces sp. NPDC000594 TaxID=3154261 RepID=UPI0033210E0C
MRLTQPPRPLPLTNPSLVTRLAIAPDGTDVVVGQWATDDGHPALSRWSLPSGVPLLGPGPCPLADGGDTCQVLVRAGNGTLAVAGITRKRLFLRDGTTGRWTEPVDGEVVWASVTGPLLATGGERARILDLGTGRTLWEQDPPGSRDPVLSLLSPLTAIHPDRAAFAVGGSGEPTVRVHPLPAGTPPTVLDGAPERLHWLGYGPTGEYLLALDAHERSAVLWRTGRNEPHCPDTFGAGSGGTLSAAFHPDGEHCVLGTFSGYLLVLRLGDGVLLDARQCHRSRIKSLAFTPDGTLLLSGGDDGAALVHRVEP